MKNSKIEWCDHTFNPWWGCTKVSPGCAHCYAEGLATRFGKDIWGKGKPRQRTGPENWKEPLKWDRQAREERFLEWAKTGDTNPRRPRVFCGSMCDWLDPELPIRWLADLLDVIRRTPHLDWLLLTKRAELWEQRLLAAADSTAPDFDQYTDPWEIEQWEQSSAGKTRAWIIYWIYAGKVGNQIPPNVWIGTSVEDQKRADERIPALLEIPAKVRFLSCEPLLEAVDINSALPWMIGQEGKEAGIHWVICGGESGPKARPMHPDWARSLRDQCQAAGVPFFFKQWGEWGCRGHGGVTLNDGKTVCWINDEAEPGICSHAEHSVRVGKQKAGRLLDGREWNEFPAGGAG